MDLLRDYVSDSNSSDEAEYVGQHDALETTNAKEEINVRSVHKVYLITYSQADFERFPTRDLFVQAVLYAFHDSPANIIQWCCCMEEHSKSSGFHFHMAVKLDKNQQWLGIKRLLERCDISVYFSAIHRNNLNEENSEEDQESKRRARERKKKNVVL